MGRIIQIFILSFIVFLIAGCTQTNRLSLTGPGSGEELPEGPGSGETLAPGQTNPPPPEDIGPGSGETLAPGQTNPPPPEDIGPGSGETLAPGQTNPPEPTGPGSGEELPPAKGSCNIIDFGSTCVEYIGSYFTWENIELHCQGTGTPSKNPCPRPTMGGCNIAAGTPNELITWHYNYGGDPFTPDVIPYSSAACNANPFGSWISGN
jgi:hypothetical protein